MVRKLRNLCAGVLALTGVAMASAEAGAMPIQSLDPGASAPQGVEQVWCCRYGWRGGWGWRRPYYGYGWGWRRPYYGWGWRRW